MLKKDKKIIVNFSFPEIKKLYTFAVKYVIIKKIGMLTAICPEKCLHRELY